jgi:dihydroflavonol-4-reductase
MLVLVTGGNGFIGSHLVEALVKKDYEVRCLVRKTSNLMWLKDVPVEYVYGDVTNPDSLASAVHGADYVYHLAGVVEAKRTETFYKVNVQGTEHLLQACVEHAPNLKRFVYASSQSAAGPCTKGTCVDESDHPNPITHYGRSNLQAEEVALSYKEKIPATIIRPPAVYGPRDTMILPYFQIVKKGIKPLLGLGRKKYISLSYVEDLVRGFILAAESDKAIGETYYIGDERAYSRAEVLDGIAEVLSIKAVTIHVPDFVAQVAAGISALLSLLAPKSASLSWGKAKELVQKYWTCDPSKAKRDFGFESHVGLREGLQITADWYKEQGWL